MATKKLITMDEMNPQSPTPPAGETPELLPCPFCGKSDAKAIKDTCAYTPTFAWIVLCSCGSCGTNVSTKALAITAWNTRADSTRLTTELADARRERDAGVALAVAVAGLQGLSFQPRPKHIEPLIRDAVAILEKNGEPAFISKWRETEAELAALRTALATALADSARYATKEEIWRRCAMFHDDTLAAERECEAIDSAMKPTP